MTEQMHRHDGARLFGYRLLNQARIKAPGVTLDVNQNRSGAGLQNGMRSGGEGEIGNYYFITRTNAECMKCR